MHRKILTLFLAIIMLISTFPLQIFSETVDEVSVDSGEGDTAIEKVQSVATIGDTSYATLKEAIAAAESGDEIDLLANFALSESVTISADKDITLDLNGKTITGTDHTDKNFGLINNVGNLTIKDSVGDGSITLTATTNNGWNRYSAVISNNPGGTLTVDGGLIEHLGGTDMAYGIDSLTNGGIGHVSVTVNGGTVKSTYRGIRQFLNSDTKNNILTINGGTVEGTNKAIFFHDPSKKANNGTLIVGESAVIKGGIYLFVTEGSTVWPVDVCIFTRALDSAGVTHKNVPDGYAVVEENGVYSVSCAVATIDDNVYYTISSAISAATANDIIKIVADIDKPDLTITLTDGVTLDLDGHVVTAKSLTVSNTSHIIDSAEPTQKGLLKVDKENLTLDNAEYLMFPIWNEQETGYVFVDFRLHNVGLITDGYEYGSFTFWFRPSVGTDTVGYFADGVLDNGLSICIELELILTNGTTADETVNFAVSDALIADVYSGTSGNNVIQLKVKGVTSDFKQVNVKMVFTSDTGMIYKTETLKSYTVSVAE